jgi:hypothetical protein
VSRLARAALFALFAVALPPLGCHPGGPRPSAGLGAFEHVTSSPIGLELDVVARPRFAGGARLELEVTARGEGLPRRWVVQKRWAGEEAVASRIHAVHARCDGVEVATVVDDLGTHLGWTFPARCAVAKLTYAIGPEPHGLAFGYEFDVQVAPALVTAIAETALVLPDCPDETPARVRTSFDLAEMAGAEGLYSLGVDRPVQTTTRAARHAYLAAGRFEHGEAKAGALSLDARFSAGFSERFDRAEALRELGALAKAEATLFADPTPETLRVLVVGVDAAGDEPAPHGTSLTSSALVWLEADAAWTPHQARLAAHEMVHLYNGQVVRRAGKDAETYWFSEGFTELLADELMLRSGIGRASQWLEAQRERLAAYASHPQVDAPNAKADMRWQGDAASLPYLRGALVAVFVDHAIRVRSGGTRALDDLMRDLVMRARRGEGPFSQEQLLSAIAAEISPADARTVRAVAIDGARIALPEDAYGRCVRVVPDGAGQTLAAAAGVKDLEACMRP